MGGFFGEGGDDAEDFAGTEGDLHAAADVHEAGEGFGDEVVELLAEGEFESDAGDHRIFDF